MDAYEPDCGFIVQYADASFIKGSLVDDTAEVGGRVAAMRFGRIRAQSQHFEHGASSGILGCVAAAALGLCSGMPSARIDPNSPRLRCLWRRLAQDALAPGFGRSPFQSLLLAGSGDGISVCLNAEGGAMVVGERAPAAWKGGPSVTVPLVGDDYYGIRLRGLHFVPSAAHGGGSPVDVGLSAAALGGSTGAVLDTGSTNVGMSVAAWAAVNATLVTHFPHVPGVTSCDQTCGGQPQDHCSVTNIGGPGVILSAAQLSQYPTLRFEAEGAGGAGVNLDLPPSLYLREVCDGGYRLGLTPLLSGAPSLLLGDRFLQGFVVEIDRGGRTVAFAPQGNCSAAVGEPGDAFPSSRLFAALLCLDIALSAAFVIALSLTLWRLRRARLSFTGARLLPEDGEASWDGAGSPPARNYQSLGDAGGDRLLTGGSLVPMRKASGSSSSWSEQMQVMNEGTL